MKHTPEPWDFVVDDNSDDPCVIVTHAETGNTIARMGDRSLDSDCPLEVDQEDAIRIVACVNACAGIEDPGTTIPQMRQVLKDLCESFESRVGDWENAEWNPAYAAAQELIKKLEPTTPNEDTHA